MARGGVDRKGDLRRTEGACGWPRRGDARGAPPPSDGGATPPRRENPARGARERGGGVWRGRSGHLHHSCSEEPPGMALEIDGSVWRGGARASRPRPTNRHTHTHTHTRGAAPREHLRGEDGSGQHREDEERRVVALGPEQTRSVRATPDAERARGAGHGSRARRRTRIARAAPDTDRTRSARRGSRARRRAFIWGAPRRTRARGTNGGTATLERGSFGEGRLTMDGTWMGCVVRAPSCDGWDPWCAPHRVTHNEVEVASRGARHSGRRRRTRCVLRTGVAVMRIGHGDSENAPRRRTC